MARKKGTPHMIDISGFSYGKWTVIERVAGSMWKCVCSCGNEAIVGGNTLKNGTSSQCKSCHSASLVKHGLEGTKIYSIWAGMKQRCNNPKYHSYGEYGGRGISVCDEWLLFENFYRDMGDKPEKMSLGRIDNNKGYSKENCQWETPKQQQRNRRNTTFIDWNGKMYALTEFCEINGLNKSTARKRFARGFTPSQLIAGKC
jgi:hypothetical protein